MTIIDADIRRQASTDLERSMALSAGAGSGKTSVLTQRLVELLAAGHDPSSIAAITFTEKAAGELSERVRDKLETRLIELSGDNTRAAEASRVATAITRLSDLTVSTIHSFCRRLLVEEALESEYAPDTSIGAEDSVAELANEAVAQWRTGFIARRTEVAPVLDELVTPFGLRKAAQLIATHRDLDFVQSGTTFDAERAFSELVRISGEIQERAGACSNPDCKLLAKTAGLKSFLSEVTTWADHHRAVLAALLVNRSVRAGNVGRAAEWSGSGKADYLDAIGQYASWRQVWLEAAHAEIVSDLEEHFIPLLDSLKKTAAKITFDDLLARAADLLRTRPAANARLSARYRVVLIDEVQDTDPKQAEVAVLLTMAQGVERPWRTAQPEPGRLFAVGDAKQSIYRFRGADAQTFLALRDVIERQGEAHDLQQNFRSVPGIVEWVNHSFAELSADVVQRAFRSSAHLAPVVYLPVEEDGDEFDAALRHLHDLFRSDAQVIDRDSGEARALRASDIMILLPSWFASDKLARRIRQSGLQCSVEGGGHLFRRDEVRLCLAALRALDEPADSASVVFALRGLFGLSMQQLAEHVQQEGSWRYTIADQPPGPVSEALRVLRRARRMRSRLSMATLLDRILAESQTLATWSILHDGASRLANIDKLKSLLSAAEAETNTAAEALALMAGSEDDLSLTDPEGDAVRLTSLFKAKGLEAPVVVLLHAKRPRRTPSAILDYACNSLALKVGDLKPPGWDELKEAEKAEEEEERRRWMYVAATRARDQLVIVGGHDTGLAKRSGLYGVDMKKGLPLDEDIAHDTACAVGENGATVLLRRAGELTPVAYREDAFPDIDAAVAALLDNPPTGGDPSGEQWAEDRRNEVRTATRGCLRWVSVSEDVARKRLPPAVVEEDLHPTVGARGGTVVHLVMESLDLQRPREDLLAQVARLVAQHGQTAGLDEKLIVACERVVRRIIDHPFLDRVRAAPFHWKETPFSYRVGKTRVVTGTIDLCFPTDESQTTWVVVDWKSHIPAEGTALRIRYERQLEHYVRAMLETVGKLSNITIEKHLIGPHEEIAERIIPDDLFALIDDPDLANSLGNLLDLGAPAPSVQADVGEPVIAMLELAWDDEKLGVGLGLSDEEKGELKDAGWTIALLDDMSPTKAMQVVASALGLSAEAVAEEVETRDTDDGGAAEE